MIVVTGATGHVGGLLAHELARRGAQFRMAVTSEERAPDVPPKWRSHGYDDAESLDRVLQPGDRVFMVSMFMPAERRSRSIVRSSTRRFATGSVT